MLITLKAFLYILEKKYIYVYIPLEEKSRHLGRLLRENSPSSALFCGSPSVNRRFPGNPPLKKTTMESNNYSYSATSFIPTPPSSGGGICQPPTPPPFAHMAPLLATRGGCTVYIITPLISGGRGGKQKKKMPTN